MIVGTEKRFGFLVLACLSNPGRSVRCIRDINAQEHSSSPVGRCVDPLCFKRVGDEAAGQLPSFMA